MLTKGLVEVRFDNEHHLCYQLHDCGPERLGAEVVLFVRELQRDSLRMKIFKKTLKKLNGLMRDNSTTEQAEKLIRDTEILESLKYNEDWYAQFSFDPMAC